MFVCELQRGPGVRSLVVSSLTEVVLLTLLRLPTLLLHRGQVLLLSLRVWIIFLHLLGLLLLVLSNLVLLLLLLLLGHQVLQILS